MRRACFWRSNFLTGKIRLTVSGSAPDRPESVRIEIAGEWVQLALPTGPKAGSSVTRIFKPAGAAYTWEGLKPTEPPLPPLDE